MSKEEVIDAGEKSIDKWGKKVHKLILEYKRLEEEAKDKGEKIDSKKLLEKAKKNLNIE